MTSGDAESWARLRLVQGESTAQVWELVASAGQTTLTVGSSPSCNWVVREEGVAPVHFSLHWDGATLRVADTFGAGNVRVDGVPVAQQWRPLAGRVRVDFGRAAIVVEASTASRSDAPHPLEPAAAPSSSAAPRQNLKATLIGVSPLTPAGGAPAQGPAVTPAPAAPVAQKAPEHTMPADSFRPRRPSDSQRAAKPTLVGISIAPGAPQAPSKSPSAAPPSQPAPATSTPAPGGQRAGIPAGTLMGIGLSEAMAQVQAPQRVGGASLGDGDQRTIQGFPASGTSSVPPAAGQPNTGRRVTQAGMVSEVPGVSPGAVARAPVRTVSSPPSGQAPSEPVPGRWQETPAHTAELVDALPGDRGVPQAVLVGPGEVLGGRRESRTPSSYPPAGPAGQQAARPRAERFSDAPTQMRDPGAMEPPRRAKGNVGAYVGIAVLTALAYFAWLYLLDHL